MLCWYGESVYWDVEDVVFVKWVIFKNFCLVFGNVIFEDMVRMLLVGKFDEWELLVEVFKKLNDVENMVRF